jgi:hypothetical protein
MAKWDPIGVNDEPNAADEYDSYINDVLLLLKNRTTTENLMEYLRNVETVRMGLVDAEGTHLYQPRFVSLQQLRCKI